MDLRKLKTLIDLVSESGVAELEIREGEDHVRIVNPTRASAAAALQPQTVITAAGRRSAAAAAPVATAAPAPEAPAAEKKTINSPMVGTFYRSPSPGAKPFVEVGQKVAAATRSASLKP